MPADSAIANNTTDSEQFFGLWEIKMIPIPRAADQYAQDHGFRVGILPATFNSGRPVTTKILVYSRPRRSFARRRQLDTGVDLQQAQESGARTDPVCHAQNRVPGCRRHEVGLVEADRFYRLKGTDLGTVQEPGQLP